MNYYQHHIGDFNNATRHLTRVERSLYRDLIELYYDKEQPLTSDEARLARLALASTEEERGALRAILEEYFVLIDGHYHNGRCDLEIKKYRSNNSAKARAGKASAEARKRKKEGGEAVPPTQSNASPTPAQQDSTGVQNQEPLTNNQQPRTKEKTTLDFAPLGISQEQLAEVKRIRRKNKGGSFSQRIITMLAKELGHAVAAGFTVDDCLNEWDYRGWKSFKAEWMPKGTPASEKARLAQEVDDWVEGRDTGSGTVLDGVLG